MDTVTNWTLRDIVAFAAYCEDVDIEDLDRRPEHGPSLLQNWTRIYLPALSQDHSGDCTQCPWTCLRCLAEAFYRTADAILAAIPKIAEPETDAPVTP